MHAALASEGRLLAEDLYGLIQSLDPAVFKADLEQSIRERTESMATRLQRLRQTCATALESSEAAAITAFKEALDALARQLDELRVRFARPSQRRSDWRAAFKGLQPRYDAIRLGLGELGGDAAEGLPAMRATNVKRSLFHMMNGIISLTALQFTPYWVVVVIACSFAAFAWTCELIRTLSPSANAAMMRVFAPLAHPHEYYKVNSATWYATALIILAFTVPPIASSLAVMVLALADPAAAIIGRRWGRVRLRAGRSLEGTIGFAVVGTVTAAAVLAVFYSLSIPALVTAALTGGIAGALAELFSGRTLDDNVTIPVAVGFATWGALALF